MRKLFVVLMVLAVVGGTAAFADQLKKGEKEVNFAFSWTSFDPGGGFDKVQQIMIDGTWGYMLTDAHEVGALTQYQRYSDGGSFNNYGLGAYYNYNFKAGTNMNPYLGARIAYLRFDDFGGFERPYKALYGVVGGIKIYPWQNAGFNFSLAWDQYQKDKADENGKQLGAFVGVLVKW
jgi:hypothetical protein